jgi:hypothetical protein
MARQLQPCGTYAAYRRHLRNGEPACDLCKQAARDQANGREGLPPRADQVSDTAPTPITEIPTPRDDALENLALVNAALQKAVPREVPALSKRRQELVEYLNALDAKKGGGLAGKLAAARAAREQRDGPTDP